MSNVPGQQDNPVCLCHTHHTFVCRPHCRQFHAHRRSQPRCSYATACSCSSWQCRCSGGAAQGRGRCGCFGRHWTQCTRHRSCAGDWAGWWAGGWAGEGPGGGTVGTGTGGAEGVGGGSGRSQGKGAPTNRSVRSDLLVCDEVEIKIEVWCSSIAVFVWVMCIVCCLCCVLHSCDLRQTHSLITCRCPHCSTYTGQHSPRLH